MRKKFLLMTFLTLLFTAMGTSVLRAQESYVAKVGDTEYAKLADAVNAAQADDEIKVIADIATNLDLTISKKVTLDLGGFTLSNAGIIIESDVTIKNGEIVNTNEPYPLKVTGSGNLTVDGVAIKASKSDRAIWLDNSSVLNFKSGSSILATKGENNTYSKIYGVWVSQGATANIYGGTITVDAGANATAVAIFGNYVNTVNIYGGKISTSGKNYSYAVYVYGDVTITGGEIVTNEKQYGYSSGITYGFNYAIYSKGDVEISGDTKITTYGHSGYIVNAGGSNQEVVITGGEFTNVLSEADKTAGGHSAPNLIYGSSVDATIAGGDFNGYKGEELIKGTGSTLTITGGSFDNMPKADYVAVGATITVGETTYTKTEDGLEVVIPVASVNGTSYTTLDDALAAASAMTGDVTVEIYEKVTLNHSLSGSYSSIKFVGKDTDAEIYLDVEGYITATGKEVAFEDLKLSKSPGGFITNAGFMNVAFGVYDVTKVTYTNCTFYNGAYASSGNVTYTGCTFKRSHDKYGLWAYGNVDVTVDGCIFDDYRGIKMYAEGAAKTVDLTVKNTNFSVVNDKPAIVLTYGESVTLENNTYSSTGVFELDLDGAPNGTPINYTDDNDEKLTCKNDNGACGVLCDGKIYTTVAQAAAVATSGSTVTLLHNSTETVELPMGVILDKNGYVAAGVTVAEPIAKIGENVYTTLEAAFEAATEGQTITLLADATPALTSQSAITKAAVIDLGGKTLTLTEDDLYFGTTEFKNGYIIVDPSVKPSTAVFWMFANQTLTFDNVKLTATGVKGTYLIGLDGNNSDLNILNGSEIIVNNATALDLDIICVNASTGNDIVVDNSKVNVKNLDGRVFFRGNYTIKGNSDIDLDGITKAGFRIEAGQTLSIEDNATVDIIGEPRDGGIHLTDLTATYTVAETATVNATVNQPVAVAQIGTTKYGTLQAAIDAVQNGETIELLSDVTENVTLEEATDVYYTINGSDKTMNGTITVNSLSDTNDNRRITIKNIKFVDTADTGVNFISSVNLNHYPRLTVEGCTFTGSGNNGDVAIRLKSSHSVVIKGCTGTGLHSFLQNTAGWNLTIENVIVTNSKSGLALGTVQGVTVKGSNIDVNGYGIRLDAQYNNNAVIESNAVKAFIPVVVRKAEVVSRITFSGTNTMTASNTDGLWCAIGTSEYETSGTMPTAPTGQVTVTLNDTGLSMDGVYGAFFPVKIGETGYATLAAAAVAAQAGDEIILLADVTEDVSLPAGITLNGNGKAVGNITAKGTITFNGHTKATSFNVENTNTTVNIVEGACLEITGTGRMVIGHGCIFNITGTITDAKTANVADLTPSLIMPGASFTGPGVTFNVTNAYISAPSSYCSSSSSASGTFDFNITNSIWESAGKLAFEAQSTAATVNFELKDSKLTTGSHLVFGVSRGEVVIDNSNVNVGTSRQIENRSTMTIKNGAVVNGAVATSSNAINPGTIIVENATYAVTGEFSGAAEGPGTLIINKDANVSVGSIKAGANVVVDAEGMAASDNINFTADLSQFTGTLSVINNDNLEAKIIDGKIVLVEKPVAKIGETEYATLQAALNAAAETEELTTIQLLAGTHTFGNVKFPATLKNVTIVGADNKATIIKDSKLNSADGNAVTYKGITFDGIVFDNSGILFTGARSGEVVYEDWTIKNCDFRDLQSIDGIAAIHFNLLADETIKNFTFEKNTITNVTSPSNTASGLRLNYVTGNVVIKDNETNNVAFNAVQIINSEVDNFTFEGNILRSNGGSLANLYNVTGENIVITKNQFLANEDQISVSNIAYADVSGNYWGGGAPENLPDGVVYSSYYTTVESDGTLGGLVELPQGNNFTGYTGVDAIWGEVWGNAKESFVIKVLNANGENGDVMGTTSLNNIDSIIDGDVTVTWSLKLDAASNTDGYWTMEWTAAPNINNMPAKVELWVDSVKVSGGPVVLNGPDNLNVIYAAVTDADGKILSYHTSIAAAAQQGNTIALLRNTDEEIKLPFGVTLNLNGFDAPNVTFTLPTAMIGETEYASVADALAAAQAANLADVVITIIGENTAATADNFNLVYNNKFDKVTFKQNNGGKVYYFNELYTGSRTNNGEFVFDGVNLVVTGQYMFEGNVKLSNNSFVKSTAEANCFVYYAEVTVEAGSKIDGVIEDIRGGSLIIDGGKTDGTYCSEPGLRDAILTVNWTSSNLVLKNGAYVKVNSANEVGRLTVNGEMRVTDSKLESYQWILVNENATLTLNAGSDITTQEVNGAGNIIVDVTGLEGQATVIKGDMTGFTGTITVNRGFYTVTADGLVVERGLSGKGTEAEPYLINDISDLEFFRDQVNTGNTYAGKYIKVTATEIDLNNEEWTPIAYMGKTFKGNFDGNNVTVKNLKITKALTNTVENNGIGFFGRTDDAATIENIIIENVDITGSLYVGAIVGFGYTGKHVKGCTVKGNIAIDAWWYAGAIGGNGYMNLIDNCHVIGNDGSYIKGNGGSYIGGIWGFRGEGNNKITNCTVTNLDIIGVDRVGGICGIGHYGNTISGCDAEDVTVTATDPEATTIGLLVGATQGNNISGQGPTIFENNDASGITAQIDNGDGTYTEVTNLYGTNIDGTTPVTNYVAQIVGGTQYATLAEAVAAAVNNDVITLLPTPTNASIAMAATIVNNKTVTITGTANVDWSKGWLYVGRNGEGNGKLIFNEANLTSKSVGSNSGLGLNVSCKKDGSNTTNDGEVEIINSNIQLDYLIGKGNIKLDNSTLNVYEGFAVGARPASETGGVQRTVTMDITNGSKVIVDNHNGQGLGYESNGIMNIDATSTFETQRSFLITADGTMNVNGGNVKVDGTLTNNGAVNVNEGENTLNITTLEGKEIKLQHGATLVDTNVGGEAMLYGAVTFKGDNTFTMIYDYGAAYSTESAAWTVEPGASLTLTATVRYGLGYGDNATIKGNITDALTARGTLTDDDLSFFTHGISMMCNWNEENYLTVNDAYVQIGSNNSFGTKNDYGQKGKFYVNFTNSVLTSSRVTIVENGGFAYFTFNGSDVLTGGWSQKHAGSTAEFTNSKMVVTGNGTDYNNANAGIMTIVGSNIEFESGAFTNTGTLNIGENSTFTAPSVVNNGAINFTALSAKLDTDTEGLTIVDQVNNPDYKVVYKDGIYQFVQKVYVAQIDNGDKFETLIEAVAAVEDGGTITLIANETFTENNRSNNGGWWDGLAYSGDKSFTIDLANFTISQDGALNDYLMWFKNDGAKANTITLKNGTLDAGTTAYCALATASSNAQKITINTENINFIGENSGGAVLKIRGGAELNVNADTKITGVDSYVGIEAAGSNTVVNIYEGAEIYQNGKSSNWGCLAGASGNSTINVYGGEGTSAKGGFIAMTSGGTINIFGGEWTANTDGTIANDNNGVLIAQSDKQYNAGAGNSIVNVTGGTFKGGYNCYGNAAGDAQINISGGNFNADPSAYVDDDDYEVVPKNDGTFDVIQVSGTQTRSLQAGWNWFSSYVDLSQGGGLSKLQTALGESGLAIKGQTENQSVQYVKIGVVEGEEIYAWTGNQNWNPYSNKMYMIKTSKAMSAEEFGINGDFIDYKTTTIALFQGWNWISYPLNEPALINEALAALNPTQGDQIKFRGSTFAEFYNGKWYPEDFVFMPGEGYMYKAESPNSFVYTKGTTNVRATNKTDENNNWMAQTSEYANNMTITAMLSIDGEIVKGNYEVAAFANGECRGSARPIYIEAIDAYVLYMTIYGDEVEELTFMYYDIDKDTEYELSNVMNYSNDAIVGTLSDPYIFSMNILGIGENSIDNINIYPNPTTTDREINLQATCDKVEVFNALGVKVAEYHNVDTLDALETAGIYVIRITNDNAVKHCRLVVK